MLSVRVRCKALESTTDSEIGTFWASSSRRRAVTMTVVGDAASSLDDADAIVAVSRPSANAAGASDSEDNPITIPTTRGAQAIAIRAAPARGFLSSIAVTPRDRRSGFLYG